MPNGFNLSRLFSQWILASQESNSSKQWRSWGGALSVITPPSRKNLPFLKNWKNDLKNDLLWIILEALTNIFNKMDTTFFYSRVKVKMRLNKKENIFIKNDNAKIIHNESFNDKYRSITTQIAIVWFRCVHL